MAITLGQGNFINGSFISQGSITLTSKNPSADFAPVMSVFTDLAHVKEAVIAAKQAQSSWAQKPHQERIEALLSLKDAFIRNEQRMADAISLEMGKIKSEALTEAKSLSARIDLMIEHGQKRVASEHIYDARAQTRYHHQGVLLVLGPYNFPAHLVNAHVIPSLLLGNSVIIKPSEVCVNVAEIYAQCLKESKIPAGVANVVHGDHVIAQALVEHPHIDGVLFTGSYKTGRFIEEKLLDQPHKIVALEMGGKNFAVVMDDADIKQAVCEIITGAFLTTGQRCTATSRVLVHEKIFSLVQKNLITIIKGLKPCKPDEQGMFGPLATKASLERFMHGLTLAKKSGAEVLVESEVLLGGGFVTPSLYRVHNNHPLNDYLGEELFGPNIALEAFSKLDDAIERINQSPYGLSNAIFSLNPDNAERIYHNTKSGVLNINRSTNNAVGQMPFGGVNKSGNQRPAGIDAVRYVTFPVAQLSQAYGEYVSPKNLYDQIEDNEESIEILVERHRIETAFEIYGIYSDFAAGPFIGYSRALLQKPQNSSGLIADLKSLFFHALDERDAHLVFDASKLENNQPWLIKLYDVLNRHVSSLWFEEKNSPSINVPDHAFTPRSRTMLDRLYRGHFVPRDKKSLVADIQNTRGAYLASIDDNPLVIFDAASQIATLGAGFLADTFQNAYDTNVLDLALMKNVDLSLPHHDEEALDVKDARQSAVMLENFLHEQSQKSFKSIVYASSGAEANERAFDLARHYGQQGTRIIAFEGAFHGRTIMALQATFNKEKRGPFLFSGYEASFIPFPETKNPDVQPQAPEGFLLALSKGDIPQCSSNDALLLAEIDSLKMLKAEILKGNICAVIIEPMQCEGGDRYATNRFFSGLRALTRALNVPLIFDEVQTGFHLGREFFWYRQLNLVDQHGRPEIPDCITLAKKAQLGICMSVWPNSRSSTPHVVHLKRALLHAHSLHKDTLVKLEHKAMVELKRLGEYFPSLVKNPRACGLAFAFDMPTNALAMELIDQRFIRGFMAYIAGERTLRFRLNMVISDDIIQQLFEKLFLALVDIRDRQTVVKVSALKDTNPPKKIIEPHIEMLTTDNFATFKDAIEAIEVSAYEEGRRDSMEYLLSWLKAKDSVGLIMHYEHSHEKIIAGYAIGGPLEHAEVDGALHDKHRGQHNTFYAANLTMNEHVRGLGLGRILKNAQVKHAAALKNAEGTSRYLFMTGRNRIGATPAMNQIIDALGSYVASIHDNQYGEIGAKALYYRLPLHRSRHADVKLPKNEYLDCQNSLQNPFLSPPPSFMDALSHNELRAIVGSKLTLSNWATPAMVRYSELLRSCAVKPLTHAYFTSGRDETVDKGLRSLRFHRLLADVVIGFSHQWLGHNTAAARSLSHDEGESQPFSFFSWPKVPHPSVVGHEQSLSHLNNLLTTIDSNKILGIMVELVGERSGLVFDEAYLKELDTIRTKTGIPLIYVDNASSLSRSGRGAFLTNSLAVKPNIMLWYSGGQLGQVLVDDKYFVEKPLTLISTWDGDEISMLRAYHNLLRAMDQTINDNVCRFEQSLRNLLGNDNVAGLGSWFALHLKSKERLTEALLKSRKEGVLLGQGFDNALMICPKPDFNKDQFDQVLSVVKSIF